VKFGLHVSNKNDVTKLEYKFAQPMDKAHYEQVDPLTLALLCARCKAGM